MADIFLSYARADKPKAQLLVDELTRKGWRVWWDERIAAGGLFDEQIADALDEARCVIVLWSRASIVSDGVKDEAAEAREREILVPALIEDVRPPLGYRRIQTVDLTGWEGEPSATALLELVEGVTTLIGPPPESNLRTLRASAESQARFPKNPFLPLTHTVCRARSVEVPHLELGDAFLRLALISMEELKDYELPEIYIGSGPDNPPVDRHVTRRKLVKLSAAEAAAGEERYLSAVRHAVEELEARVVCVNELGFPATAGQHPHVNTWRRVQRLSARHQCLIVGGTSHDVRTYQNTGYLFYPPVDEPRDPLSIPPVQFHKQISAVTVRERITTPPNREVLCSTKIFGLHFGVLVCLDLADFATVRAAVQARDYLDVLLLPCYTPKMEGLKLIARAASEAMPGIVILVNYQRKAEIDYAIFEFGDAVEADTQPHRASGSEIHVLEVDVRRFRERKTNPQVTMDLQRKWAWLFGPPDGPIRSD